MQSFRFGYGPDFLEALVVIGQDSFQGLLRVCLSKETKLEVSSLVMPLPTRSLLWFSWPLPQALITTSYVAPKRSIGPQNNSSLINVQKSDWDWNRSALLTQISHVLVHRIWYDGWWDESECYWDNNDDRKALATGCKFKITGRGTDLFHICFEEDEHWPPVPPIRHTNHSIHASRCC